MTTSATDRLSPRLLFAAVAACFLVSGAAGLLYEVVWLRLLGVLFGHTVYSITTVLAAFMGGLALGSALLGRWADRVRRPLLVYGLFEAAIGAYCVSTPLLFRAVEHGYLALAPSLTPGSVTAGLVQFALAALLLLPPTTLMGATLPLLSRAVVGGPAGVGAGVGALYSLNTWGAVAGTAMTGFFFIPSVGVQATLWIGVALNAVAGGTAVLLHRRVGPAAAASTPAPQPAEAPPSSGATLSRPAVLAVLVAIGVSGAASMTYEISWTRALSVVLGSSTYAFSAMLTTFLVGIALGALAVSRLLRRRPATLFTFGLVEALVAVSALAFLPFFDRLPGLVLRLLVFAGPSSGSALAAQFAASFLVMILPAMLIGATFPLVIAVLSRRLDRLGRDIGVVYGANTLGTIAGSMIAGFALLPAVGAQRGVLIAAGANLAAALAVLLPREAGRFGRPVAAALVVLFGVAALTQPKWDERMMMTGAAIYAQQYIRMGGDATDRLREAAGKREVLMVEEGLHCTVSVERNERTLFLTVNGKIDASNGFDLPTQALVGHLPLFAHPRAKRALVVGLATGMTVTAVAEHPLEQIDVAEIEPAMVRASRFFERENRKVLDDPRVRLVMDDARHVLAASAAPYDVIVSEPSNPWIAGVGSLFTRDFYLLARSKLAPDGVMVQWLQGYSIFPADMQMVVRTFQEVFPHVSVWRSLKGDYLLLATPGPLAFDFEAMRAQFLASPAMQEDFARLRWRLEQLPIHFVLGEEEARAFGAGAQRNTDDLPLLEFHAPLALYSTTVEENDRFLRSFRRSEFPATGGFALDLSTGAGRLEAARVHWSLGNADEARDQIDRMGPPQGLELELRAGRARLLLAMGLLDESLPELTLLDTLSPGSVETGLALRSARALAARGLGPALARAAAPGSTWNPAATYTNVGNFLVAVGVEAGEPALFLMAVEQFELALRFEPDAYEVINNYGTALFELGRFDEAIGAFQRALSLHAQSVQARFNLGLALESSGRLEAAAASYEEAVRAAPDWAAPRERLQGLRQARPVNGR